MTAIEWTWVPGFKGETWNPVTGCDRISPGCSRCYARTMAKRLKAMGNPRYQRDGDGPGFGVQMHRDLLVEPLRWRKPRAVFVNSMSDLFHEEVPDAFLVDVFQTMAQADRHIFMVLTKRPERARDFYSRVAHCELGWLTHNGDDPTSYGGTGLVLPEPWPIPNLWLGTSIENSRFTWRADVLREIPAAVRFISAEPLLGSLFQDARDPNPDELTVEERRHIRAPLNLERIDWVIVGGESGHGARPMHPDWARELRDACIQDCALCREGMPRVLVGGGESFGHAPIWWHDDGRASYSCGAHGQRGPAFFFKQHGAWVPGMAWTMVGERTRETLVMPDGITRPSKTLGADAGEFRRQLECDGGVYMRLVGKKAGGRVLDGREWSEFPRSAAA